MLEKYLEVCDLLEKIGFEGYHLNSIYQKVKSPDFQYKKEDLPEILICTFLASSYWLDMELFDESCLYKMDYKNVLSQKHLKMLDIGCTLIDKGFPIEYIPENYTQTGPHQLGGYVKTFVEQCHKRHAFLQERISHKKKNDRNLTFQKTLE